MAMLPRTAAGKFSKGGDFHLCGGAWHSKNWQKLHYSIVFYVLIWGLGALLGALSPPKPPVATGLMLLLRSINYSSAQTKALNMLIKRIPWNAGSGVSSPCSFARNAMFSSLFAVLELGGRCATLLSWSNSAHCSEGSELDCQSISLACDKPSCLLYLLRHLCGCQGQLFLIYLRRCISVELPGAGNVCKTWRPSLYIRHDIARRPCKCNLTFCNTVTWSSWIFSCNCMLRRVEWPLVQMYRTELLHWE